LLKKIEVEVSKLCSEILSKAAYWHRETAADSKRERKGQRKEEQ
jgi:hypothetical protein